MTNRGALGDNFISVTIKCPRCGRKTKWEGNRWRPFCSRRCKTLDLGAWASQDYRIEGEEARDEKREEDREQKERLH